MKQHHLHLAIIAGMAMAASIAGCTPDKKDTTTAAPAPMSAEPVAPTPPPVVSAPSEIPAGQAVVSLKSANDMKVSGDLNLTAEPGGVHISGTINGLTPGTQHGFHIHETGDCSAADFKSAGGHFNPGNKDHGNPTSDMHHAGDMMNLAVND
ncbi:MAG: superoxide dismutase family protein, partial [Dokdonella sp.]